MVNHSNRVTDIHDARGAERSQLACFALRSFIRIHLWFQKILS
jgi:CRISPR/Cas system CMR-associated protein Cmr5 small subunit